MNRVGVACAAGLLTLLVACGGSNGGSQTSLTKPSPSSSSPTTPTRPAATAPATSASGGSAARAGLGVTDAVWEARHSQDHRFTAGKVYDPRPDLVATHDAGHNDRYYAVTHSGGHVTGYSMRFAWGTSIDAARAAVVADLPTDTATAWSTKKDICSQTQLRSPTIASELGGNDATGAVLVSFYTSSDTPYQAGNVLDAVLLPIDEAAPSAAPAC